MDRPRRQFIGRYQVIEKIGRGGMADVYRAYDPEIDREVAIKVLRMLEDMDAEERENLAARFKHEIAMMSSLKHPNILRAYDSGQEGEQVYLVMSYFGGGSMERLIGKNARLELNQINSALQQVAAGLHFAHTQDIIHRDIKPSNILIHHVDGHLVLSDFGIAKALSSTTQLTGTGTRVGTPLFMAPEQFDGIYSPASDIYSLGIVIYRFVVGKFPFSGQNFSEIAFKHFQKEAPTLVGQGLTGYEELDWVFQLALAKNPQDRFKTPLDFSAAFGQAAANTLARSGRTLTPYVFDPKGSDQTQALHLTPDPISQPKDYQNVYIPNKPSPSSNPPAPVNLPPLPPPPPPAQVRSIPSGPFNAPPNKVEPPAYSGPASGPPINPPLPPKASASPVPNPTRLEATPPLTTNAPQAVGSRRWLLIALPLVVLLLAGGLILFLVNNSNSTKPTPQSTNAATGSPIVIGFPVGSTAPDLTTTLATTKPDTANATTATDTTPPSATTAATTTLSTTAPTTVATTSATTTTSPPTTSATTTALPTKPSGPLTIFGQGATLSLNSNNEPQNPASTFKVGDKIYLFLNFGNADPAASLDVYIDDVSNDKVVWSDRKIFGKAQGFIIFNKNDLPAGSYQAIFQQNGQNLGTPVSFTVK